MLSNFGIIIMDYGTSLLEYRVPRKSENQELLATRNKIRKEIL